MRRMDVDLRQDGRSSDSSVENVGIKIRSGRPNYGAQLRIDPNLSEVGAVTQGLEDSPETKETRKIDDALNAVLKPKLQAIIAKCFCGNDVLQHLYSRGAIVLSCASALARFQSSISSSRCRAAHSATRPNARGEICPR